MHGQQNIKIRSLFRERTLESSHKMGARWTIQELIEPDRLWSTSKPKLVNLRSTSFLRATLYISHA